MNRPSVVKDREGTKCEHCDKSTGPKLVEYFRNSYTAADDPEIPHYICLDCIEVYANEADEETGERITAQRMGMGLILNAIACSTHTHGADTMNIHEEIRNAINLRTAIQKSMTDLNVALHHLNDAAGNT